MFSFPYLPCNIRGGIIDAGDGLFERRVGHFGTGCPALGDRMYDQIFDPQQEISLFEKGGGLWPPPRSVVACLAPVSGPGWSFSWRQ